MTLHELIAKLEARGCPEHPRLVPVYAHERVVDRYDAKTGEAKKWHDVTTFLYWRLREFDFAIDESDARAILTVWAEPWLLRTVLSIVIERRRGLGVPVWYRIVYFEDNLIAEGPDILEAIEAATRHLETK